MPAAGRVEVVVELAPPALGRAGYRTGGERLRSAAAELARAQAAFERRLAAALPAARIAWRYRVVLDGLAVSVPASQRGRLARLPGVRAVYPSVRYHGLAAVPARSGGLEVADAIGASALWGPGLAVAGQGVKIGIVDDGVDQRHPYFSPAGFTVPEGYPRGNRAYTTARVIVARAFPPPGAVWKYAARPFDPRFSYHGTHVAGIAAGGPVTLRGGARLSGVAPRAFVGNYRALTVPTASGVGLDGSSPELVAAIEAAVADGMDVINLSLGEPEVPPSRDVVAAALENAAAAGVVPVVAAGNSFEEEGDGSVGSPGSAPSAITVAATDFRRTLASFSSAGPTTLGLQAKPDVAAPGVDVVSSLPGGYGELSGTSMAAPHVAGAAALLRQLHPGWSVAQVKSALVQTGRPVLLRPGRPAEAPVARAGGGFVDLPAAAEPLLLASPQQLGLGFLDVSGGGLSLMAQVSLQDAGGGAGQWEVSVRLDGQAAGVAVAAPATAEVPGMLTVDVTAAADAREGDRSGSVVLRRGAVERRVPFWLRVTRPRLPEDPYRTLPGPGTYGGDAAAGLALVRAYRYPAAPSFAETALAGPEAVFRVTVPPGAANLGVAVLRQGRGVQIEPRLVWGADENRLAGVPALPAVTNPYLERLGEPLAASAALLPEPGTYSLVFDTRARRFAGRFRFRVWVDDTTPPAARLLARAIPAHGTFRVAVSDAGAGVDPRGIRYRLDGGPWRRGRLAGGGRIALLPTGALAPGRHRLAVTVADRQEAKNDENVARILSNTRTLRATVRVR